MIQEKISNKKIKLVWADTNKDFIKYIATEAVNWHNHPVVDGFCQDFSEPETLYEIARGIKEIKGLPGKIGIIYHPDPRGLKMEKLQSPVRIIERLKMGKKVTGDCDDKVFFLSTCLLNRGYEVKVIGAHYVKPGSDPNSINHTYLEFKKPEDKNWIPLDPSARKGIFGVKPASVYPIVKYKCTPEMLSVKKVAANVEVSENVSESLKEVLWEM